MTNDIYLGIDFGTKRIGLAVSHGTLAEPLAVIANDTTTLDSLAQICRVEHITQLVVGLSENQMADLTRSFAQQVQERIKLPLVFTDETLSSHQAGTQLKERGQTKPGQKAIVDSFAAANFLQDYLDTL